MLCAGAAVPTSDLQEFTQQLDQQPEPADSRLNPGRFIKLCIVVNKNMNDKHTELSRACAGVTMNASSSLGQQPAPSDAQQDQGHSLNRFVDERLHLWISII